jgi:hypothetical protein
MEELRSLLAGAFWFFLFLGEPRFLGASAIGFLLNLHHCSGNEQTVLQLAERAYRRGAEERRLAEKNKSRVSF